MSPIIDRIQKLIAHERSARSIGNTAEAQAFAERIQQILLKHKLTMSEVEVEDLDKDDPLGYSEVHLKTAAIEKWQIHLADSVAESFFSKVLFQRGNRRAKGRFTFLGRDSDRTTAISVFQYLSGLGVELSGKFTTDNVPSVEHLMERVGIDRSVAEQARKAAVKTCRRDFLHGFAAAIHVRLKEGMKAAAAGASGASAALILHDHSAIETYMADRFQVEETRFRKPKLTISGAAHAGYRTGNSVALSARPELSAGESSHSS